MFRDFLQAAARNGVRSTVPEEPFDNRRQLAEVVRFGVRRRIGGPAMKAPAVHPDGPHPESRGALHIGYEGVPDVDTSSGRTRSDSRAASKIRGRGLYVCADSDVMTASNRRALRWRISKRNSWSALETTARGTPSRVSRTRGTSA